MNELLLHSNIKYESAFSNCGNNGFSVSNIVPVSVLGNKTALAYWGSVSDNSNKIKDDAMMLAWISSS